MESCITKGDKMNRDRAYYRKQRAKHIARKKRMIKEWSTDGTTYWICPNGALNKGKIHCSCWMCRRKSYDDKSHKDLARIAAMNQSEAYYKNEGYEFEDYSLSDAEWHWIQVEEYYYYQESYYYEWLDKQKEKKI